MDCPRSIVDLRYEEKIGNIKFFNSHNGYNNKAFVTAKYVQSILGWEGNDPPSLLHGFQWSISVMCVI